MLSRRKLCVCEITAILNLAPSTVSKHLSILKDAGFIEDEKNGKWVDYRLADDFEEKQFPQIISLLNIWLNDDKQILKDIELLKHNDLCSILGINNNRERLLNE